MNVIDKGGSVGLVNGIQCTAWIRTTDGQRYDYVREAFTDELGGTPLNQLSQDEQLLAPGVIYAKADPETSPPCCAGECELCGV